MALAVVKPKELLKIDIGCGINKKPGFTGWDVKKFDGVDLVIDVGKKKWPLDDNSVSEIHASHFLEHLEADERIHFVNEAYRVLVDGGTISLITPHWCSQRAYGDLTHKWPPVSEMWFYYLDKDWRAAQAPHNDKYTCHFGCVWGYGLHPALAIRNSDYQQHAQSFYKEAIYDMHATMTAKK